MRHQLSSCDRLAGAQAGGVRGLSSPGGHVSQKSVSPGLRCLAGAVPGPRRQGLPADPRAGGQGVRGGGRRGPRSAPGVGRADHADGRRGAPAARPGVAAGDGRRHHPGGLVDLRPLTRERGGPAIHQRSDVRESLTDCLRDLHLPAMRRDHESAAERARQESSSYEAYLLDLAERECEARRANRVERLLQESRLLMEKSLATPDLKRPPAKAAQQVRSLPEGGFVSRYENVLIFGNPGSGKTHMACAIGQELIRSGRKVAFVPCSLMVQDPLASKRDLKLRGFLKKISRYQVL